MPSSLRSSDATNHLPLNCLCFRRSQRFDKVHPWCYHPPPMYAWRIFLHSLTSKVPRRTNISSLCSSSLVPTLAHRSLSPSRPDQQTEITFLPRQVSWLQLTHTFVIDYVMKAILCKLSGKVSRKIQIVPWKSREQKIATSNSCTVLHTFVKMSVTKSDMVIGQHHISMMIVDNTCDNKYDISSQWWPWSQR